MKGFCNTPVEEQETVIQFDRTETTINIYTCDKMMITKLDKLYPRAKEDVSDRKIRAVTYEIPKRLLSFRNDPKIKPVHAPKKQLSEKHLLALQEGRKKASRETLKINSIVNTLF